MRLITYLLVVVFITSSLCLLTVSVYALYKANQSTENQFLQAEATALSTLNSQVFRIATGREYIKRIPDYISWDDIEMTPGICVSFLAYHSNLRSGHCKPNNIKEAWPDWFETLYWEVFSPKSNADYIIQYADKEYGLLSISQNKSMYLSSAWKTVKQLMSYSIFVFITLSILLFLSLNFALRPLKIIHAKLNQIANQNLAVSLPVFSITEWRETTSVMNHMLERLKSSQQENQRLLFKLITVQEQERKNLAYELHDQLGQSLTGLSASNSLLKKLVKSESEVIQSTLNRVGDVIALMHVQLRHILDSMHPTEIDDLGLNTCLHSLINYWQQHCPNTKYELLLCKHLDYLPNEKSLQLFRIIQEALTNIAKHAKAKNVSVSVQFNTDESQLQLIINDDGELIELDSLYGGRGVVSISERVKALGATLSLSKSSNNGLNINIVTPLDELEVRYGNTRKLH